MKGCLAYHAELNSVWNEYTGNYKNQGRWFGLSCLYKYWQCMSKLLLMTYLLACLDLQGKY